MGGKEQDRKNNNKKNQVDESAIFFVGRKGLIFFRSRYRIMIFDNREKSVFLDFQFDDAQVFNFSSFFSFAVTLWFHVFFFLQFSFLLSKFFSCFFYHNSSLLRIYLLF